ncbi:hypothetical protein OF83DRAFT_1049094 [Amylostereum chailletii]|nr:hypothetical protein OF83DRAFT_1049094 [Amylostereum chailletii]
MHPAYDRAVPRPPPLIPSGARRPDIPSPTSAWNSYADELLTNAPSDFLPHGYGYHPSSSSTAYYPPSAPLPSTSQPYLSPNGWQRPRTTSAYEPDTATFAFPEPTLYRSTSAQPSPPNALRPSGHRSSRSDSGMFSGSSPSPGRISPQASPSSLESEEGLRLFQSGHVPESEEEWHRFVPQEALEAVGKHEVERQSVLFEVIKSEKEYVADLELLKEIYIEGLRNEQPEIIPQSRRSGFIQQVFGNIERILSHHQRMLGSLFSRQFDQHPLIQSIADIILDNALLFMPEYEAYMKNAPISLEWHRKELKRNPSYEGFLQRCSHDSRVRKRDIKTLLSRPVTRLPRLKLLLERIEKVTEPEHPDIEQLPLIMSVLSSFIKSTEPGIVVSESKVKFWGICESLVYSRGEIIDLDLYDDSRTLVYSSALARRQRSDNWNSWTDLMGVLLDNYFLLLKEDSRGNAVKRQVISRPIPLEYMRLGPFTDPPEARRERGDSIIASLSGSAKQDVYPFTFYHAGARNTRRYTLYAPSANMRKKWHDAFSDAIGIRKVQQESNRWFASQPLNDGFFRVISARLTFAPGAKLTGRVSCAVAFCAWNNGRSFLAVGCSSGIYVGLRADSSFRKVLPFVSPTSMAVLQDFNKFIVHHETSLMSYSLDLVARVAQGQSTQQNLEGSLERLAGNDGNVLFFRAGRLSERTIVVYASKSFMQVTLHALEATNTTETSLTAKRTRSGHISYRSFGSPCYVPRDAYDITFLPKSVAICTDKGIVIVNPTKCVTKVVPDFGDAYGNAPMTALKSRCESGKVLGLVRVDASELMVIYDEMACYITKHGHPSRSSGYVRWESKAVAYTRRGAHILLFSPDFVEVRTVQTGRLVQVIEGREVRLLQRGLGEDEKEMLIVGLKGEHDDKTGVSEKLVELVQTSEIRKPTAMPPTKGSSQGMWEEWDMGFG